MKSLAFIILIGIAATAPVLGTVALIKLVTDIKAIQVALAVVLTAPTFFASLLSAVWVGEKFDEMFD